MRYRLNRKIMIDSDHYVIIFKGGYTHLGITFRYRVVLRSRDEYGDEWTEKWTLAATWPGAIEAAAELYNDCFNSIYG